MSDIALHDMTNIAAAPQRSEGLLNQVRRTLATWSRRAESRRHLARFDSHLMRDLGITPGELEREVSKPFWQA